MQKGTKGKGDYEKKEVKGFEALRQGWKQIARKGEAAGGARRRGRPWEPPAARCRRRCTCGLLLTARKPPPKIKGKYHTSGVRWRNRGEGR